MNFFSTYWPAKNRSPQPGAPRSTAGAQAPCLLSKSFLRLLSVTFCPSQRPTLSFYQCLSLVTAGGSFPVSLLGEFLWCGERSDVGLSFPLFIPLKDNVSAQPFPLSTAAQPCAPTLALAVKDLRLAPVPDPSGLTSISTQD